ncbi:hypothetical protein [Desulfurobacterium crinifex]
MSLIQQYGIDSFTSIRPYEGFWIKTIQPVSVEFCSITGTTDNASEEGFEEFISPNIPVFLNGANGRVITIFEDEAITCQFQYDGNRTFTLTNCSNPEFEGTGTLDNMTIVDDDGNYHQIVWADNNTLCVNYEENGIYRTSCAVINVPQPTDEEILAGLTNGSRVGFWYNPEIADWEPTGICSTYYDNGTVVYRNDENNIVGICTYTVEDGTLVTTCETENGTITKVGKAISPFALPEEGVYGKIVNGKFYVNGELVKWGNFISIQVESCEQFWEEFNEEETPQDYSNVISGRVTYNGTISDDLKIRITPDVEQIDGDWGGIVCQINSDGSFGDRCVLHGDINNYNDQHQFQIIIFHDVDGDWHWEPTEPDVHGIGNVSFGSWESIEF